MTDLQERKAAGSNGACSCASSPRFDFALNPTRRPSTLNAESRERKIGHAHLRPERPDLSTPYSTSAVLAVYQQHPLTRDSILGRIRRQGGNLSTVRELDLAVDGIEALTDQNHIGGALGTLRLAAYAGICNEDNVLDLGCGIGGPLRLLSEVYGCRGHGIDANNTRIQDAVELTAITRLDGRLTFEHADILEITPRAAWSVVLAQNSWIHIDLPGKLAAIAASSLRPGGRLAFEDVLLTRQPRSAREEQLMAELRDAWRSSFSSLDDWRAAFTGQGFTIAKCAADGEILERDCTWMAGRARSQPERYPPHEIAGWECALELYRAGVIDYWRVIATL
jgi:SAM-dependent methyltransferase